MKSCIENNPIKLRRMRYLMNTFCLIQAGAEEEGMFPEDAIEAAFAELKRIENTFSRYTNSSQIYQINQNAYERPVKVDDEVFWLIKRSLGLSKLTGGAFDITIGAAVDLWRWAESRDILPTDSQIKRSRRKIGWQGIILNEDERSIRFTQEGAKLDLGAFAKGYGLDRAAAKLKEYGARHAQINLGGHIYILNETPQAVSIRNPLFSDETAATVTIMNSSISTSADYERHFMAGGRRFSHLINPQTAMPVESDILSVSVISPDASLADALSTAIFVSGFKESKELLRRFEGMETVIITKALLPRQVKVYKWGSLPANVSAAGSGQIFSIK